MKKIQQQGFQEEIPIETILANFKISDKQAEASAKVQGSLKNNLNEFNNSQKWSIKQPACIYSSDEQITSYLKNQRSQKELGYKQNSCIRWFWNDIIIYYIGKLLLILQMLWLQLIPIEIRGKVPGEVKNASWQSRIFKGSPDIFINQMKINFRKIPGQEAVRLDYFFLIIHEDVIVNEGLVSIDKVISHQKLRKLLRKKKNIYILSKTQYNVHILNANSEDTIAVQTRNSNLEEINTCLLVCKMNQYHHLLIFGSLELKDVQPEDLSYLLNEMQIDMQNYAKLEKETFQQVKLIQQTNETPNNQQSEHQLQDLI